MVLTSATVPFTDPSTGATMRRKVYYPRPQEQSPDETSLDESSNNPTTDRYDIDYSVSTFNGPSLDSIVRKQRTNESHDAWESNKLVVPKLLETFADDLQKKDMFKRHPGTSVYLARKDAEELATEGRYGSIEVTDAKSYTANGVGTVLQITVNHTE